MDKLVFKTIQRSGSKIEISIEEGRNFRRLAFSRSRLLFDSWRELGSVYFYPDELSELASIVDTAEFWMARIADIGFEAASGEVSDGRR